MEVRIASAVSRKDLCLAFLHHVLFMRQLVDSSIETFLTPEEQPTGGSGARARRLTRFNSQLQDLVGDLRLFESDIQGDGKPRMHTLVTYRDERPPWPQCLLGQGDLLHHLQRPRDESSSRCQCQHRLYAEVSA